MTADAGSVSLEGKGDVALPAEQGEGSKRESRPSRMD